MAGGWGFEKVASLQSVLRTSADAGEQLAEGLDGTSRRMPFN